MEELIKFLEEEINKCKIMLTFDADYLTGKLEAYQEILKKLKSE